MRYLWYGFLGIVSLGFLGAIAAVVAVSVIINYYGQNLPDYQQLKDYKPPIVTRVYAGDGRLMAEFAQEKRVFIPIEEVPDLVKNAFIAAEDQNFYKHEGVDIVAVARAAVLNLKNRGSGKRPKGASTITQQVAKNFLLTNEVSYERKIKEAILAYRMEKAMPKDRLLELYLNEIFLGSRSYGVAAAALQYFNKSLDELTIAEAAYLAALPKAPNNYHPVRKHDAAVERRNWVIGRMREDGYITRAEEAAAVQMPLEVVKRDEAGIVTAPYFAEEVRRFLGEHYGEESLYKGGLAVRTTIDPALQDIAVRSLRAGLMDYDRRHGWRGPVAHVNPLTDRAEAFKNTPAPAAMLESWRLAYVTESGAREAKLAFSDDMEGVLAFEQARWARKCVGECYALGPEITAVSDVVKPGDMVMVERMDPDKNTYELRQIPVVEGALIALDPHTGRVLAMQGGWTYGISEFNRATQAQRQPGSAFKPFVYLAALENGFTPATLVLDAPFVIEDRPGHFWSPVNYSGEFYGPTPIRVGVEKSRNLMTVRLAHYLGMEKIAEKAGKFGVVDNMPLHLANALGANETTLLKMTSAYGVLVNGGRKIEPSFIDRIQDRRGKTIFRHDGRSCANCGSLIKWLGQEAPEIPDTGEQLTDPRNAYQMVSILEGVVQRGTAISLKSLNRPLAGKTGTTNESHDSWFIGFSPDLVVGVYAGFDEPRSLGKRETGASIAVPIFKQFMEEALADVPPMPFRVPPGIKQVQINESTGARASGGEANIIWESFVDGTEPTGEVVILGENGLNTMGGGEDLSGTADAFSTAPGSGPGPGMPGDGVSPEPGTYDGSAPAGPGATTGTGGIY